MDVMERFEERVLADLSELKVQVRFLVGGGNEGKIQEIEQRLQRHESHLQRLVGVGSALAAAITVLNLVANWLRLHR
jgi:hypothetical protein